MVETQPWFLVGNCERKIKWLSMYLDKNILRILTSKRNEVFLGDEVCVVKVMRFVRRNYSQFILFELLVLNVQFLLKSLPDLRYQLSLMDDKYH